MQAAGAVPGAMAKLSTTAFPTNYGFCFSFYYHMYGGEMGALRVLVDDQVAWELSGNQGDQWLRAVVAARNPGYHLVSAHQKPNFRVIEPSTHPLFAF